ncbi:hypothetical protein TNCV_3923811 [Trichonephila clavipes]|nr:hypothetical protein TNCV_3923811 [Trichonephila clavipes]
MFDPSSFVNPTPLAHADASRDVLPRGVNFPKMFYSQTYPHSEEFGTVIKDDDGTNVDSEKELSLEQKLGLAITKKISKKPKYHTEISYIQNHPTRDLQKSLESNISKKIYENEENTKVTYTSSIKETERD